MTTKDAKRWFEWLPGWWPVVVSLIGGCWWLSSQLTQLKDQSVQMRQDIGEIKQHLGMKPKEAPQSYTVPEDPSLSKFTQKPNHSLNETRQP
jgi:hypothetical protein